MPQPVSTHTSVARSAVFIVSCVYTLHGPSVPHPAGLAWMLAVVEHSSTSSWCLPAVTCHLHLPITDTWYFFNGYLFFYISNAAHWVIALGDFRPKAARNGDHLTFSFLD